MNIFIATKCATQASSHLKTTIPLTVICKCLNDVSKLNKHPSLKKAKLIENYNKWIQTVVSLALVS